jgi:hypothetical protein
MPMNSIRTSLIWMLTYLAFATYPALADDATVLLRAQMDFASDAAVDVSRLALGVNRRKSIEDQCQLQTRLPAAIAQQAVRRGIKLRLAPTDEELKGRVLTIIIEGVLGAAGGAWTGTKTLVLRGELHQDGALVASFVAREQQTALTQNTCESLLTCGEKIAGHIAKWLKKPVLKARLGSA